MPDTDEHWRRIWVVIAPLLVAGATLVLFPVIRLVIAPVDDFFRDPAPQLTVCGLLLFAAAIQSYRKMRQARERTRLRRLALSGDTSAMPIAGLDSDIPRDSDVASVPLSLLWQRLDEGAQPSGVIADEQGITLYRADGSMVTMAWTEARLWEICHRSDREPWIWAFVLYGEDTRIIWYIFANRPKSWKSVGFERSELFERIRTLSGIVATHTGLQLRTLSPRMMDQSSSAKKAENAARSRRWRYVGTGLAAVLLVVAVYMVWTANSVSIPLIWLACAFGFSSIALISFALGSLLAVRALRRRAPTPPYALPIFSALPQPPVIFAHAVPLSRRLISLLLGVTLLPTYIAYALAVQDMPLDLTQIVGFLALSETIIGIGFLWLVLRMPAFIISADEDGLSSSLRGETHFLAWDEIASVEADQTGWDVQFAANGADDRTIIFWNLEPGSNRRLPLGVTRVTADQLAAIVVQRSGKPLVVEHV